MKMVAGIGFPTIASSSVCNHLVAVFCTMEAWKLQQGRRAMVNLRIKGLNQATPRKDRVASLEPAV